MIAEEIDFVSISTEGLAPPNVVSNLLGSHDTGEKRYSPFKESMLETDASIVKFYDNLPNSKLKTFSDIRVKRAHMCKDQSVVLKADRKLFGQMILVAESRKLHMKDVLDHPLGPLPWALANSDGTLRKTDKAALATELEKHVSPAENIPTESTCIIDGMLLIQRINGCNKTFTQLADSALQMVLI